MNPHLLQIETLGQGWHDKDEVLLHAAFQLLVDFVEKEKLGKLVDWNADVLHREAWLEIKSLYNWWTKQRPKGRDTVMDHRLAVPKRKYEKADKGDPFRRLIRPDRKKYRIFYSALEKGWRLERTWHAEDQNNLRRLINIRPFLWV